MIPINQTYNADSKSNRNENLNHPAERLQRSCSGIICVETINGHDMRMHWDYI